jgi:hypothetical protein
MTKKPTFGEGLIEGMREALAWKRGEIELEVVDYTSEGKITTTKWDTTDYLKTEEDIEACLEACREENDPEFMERANKDVERARERWALKKGA